MWQQGLGTSTPCNEVRHDHLVPVVYANQGRPWWTNLVSVATQEVNKALARVVVQGYTPAVHPDHSGLCAMADRQVSALL